MEFALCIGMIFGCCIGIMKFCGYFEDAAGYLGRNMQAGAKGALVDAIGSSMPELLVTLAFVLTGKPELILAGIAVTAGSAIFNAVLIPAFSILYMRDGLGNRVKSFSLDRKVILRDGAYLLAVEGFLIWVLGQPALLPWHCITLLCGYAAYAFHVMRDSKNAGEGVEAYDGDVQSLGKALFLLAVGVIGLGVFCHFLAESITDFATLAGWPVFITAAILGAAATSLPDTILSIGSAENGEGEDAVCNAIGSNIFDVTVVLAVPALLAMVISGGEPLAIEASAALTALRWFVLGTSALVIGILAVFAEKITHTIAIMLIGIYGIWCGYCAYIA